MTLSIINLYVLMDLEDLLDLVVFVDLIQCKPISCNENRIPAIITGFPVMITGKLQ